MELKHIAVRQGRLSSFLKEELRMSTGLMNRLKWQDRLFVNGIPRHTDFSVCPGDVITVLLDEPQPEYPPEPGELHILYEDAHFLAVDKPAGMLIHPSRARLTGTLANRVLAYYLETGQASAFHPITRLDRDTLGVVLLAKNSHIHALFTGQGDLQKTYHARVFGTPPAPAGKIDAPIDRKPLPSLLRFVGPEGKPSLTEYRVLEQDENTALLALKPITGRTHQLRIHCAYMGCPILGDPQYGTEESTAFSLSRNLQTQSLCAKEVRFTHPITGQKIQIRSELEV